MKQSATCCVCLCQRHFNFPPVSSSSVGASPFGDQKKILGGGSIFHFPHLTLGVEVPQGLQSHVRERLLAQKVAKWGRECCPALSSASKSQVEQPTGGSVMTLSEMTLIVFYLQRKKRAGQKGLVKKE